ncbi:MAG: serpin family protein [Deltaproteobacteria bacterium]|nr:serpin family protein [Deltaproteobacteria bacterium]
MLKICRRIGICAFALISFVQGAVADVDSESLVENNSTFAFDLYKKLSPAEGNLFFSPYSISSALAMTYAGARGDTAKQMASVLNFKSQGEKGAEADLHSGFAALQKELAAAAGDGNVTFEVANSLWPQKGHEFLNGYLSLLKQNYDVVVTALDYAAALEEARLKINTWVEEKTHNKIRELIKPGVLTALTRMVLINAVYFKGKWEFPFEKSKTKEAPFYVSAEKQVPVQMMFGNEHLGYAEDDGLQILEIPYAGGRFSMMVLLPKERDGLREIEKRLSADNLARWRRLLGPEKVQVSLPKFSLTSEFRLEKELSEMGIKDAFDVSKADFSGMDGERWLYIDSALHKAWLEVSEEGAEAAAATGMVMVGRSAVILPKFKADHPFIFLIQEKPSGAVLFLGRFSDPSPKK